MWLKASACFLALALVAWVIFDSGKDSGILKESQKNAAAFQALLKERDQARADLERQQSTLNGQIEAIRDENLKEIDSLRLASNAGRVESDGLRDELKTLEGSLRKQSATTSTTGQQLDSTTKAAILLSQLLGTCSAERQELSGSVDEYYAQGLRLAEAYNAARDAANKKPAD